MTYQMFLLRSTDDSYTTTKQVGFIQKFILDCVYDNQLDVHWLDD